MKKIIITLILIITLIFVWIITKKITLINSIKNNFNNYIVTNKETNLYDEKHSIIGTVSENTYFELENIKTKTNKYYKIADSEYYLYYKDVKKTDKNTINEKNYYVEISKIITNDTTNFYQNNELKITINKSLELNVKRKDDNNYYTTYLNQTYQIKKDDIIEEKEIETNNATNYISVLNYNKVEDTCNETNCVTLENFKNQLNYLKENNYYTINIEDYKNWLNKNINLKEKTILITSKQENINTISQEYNLQIEQNFDEIEFTDLNKKSTQEDTIISRYNITTKTTIDTFKEILNGEPITYIERNPILQAHILQNENENATEIAVLNYHFFYDPEIGEDCPDGNCKKVQDFENELLYLKENNYKTLTMEEFTKWMYNEIELPARSVLITIDDGALGTGKHNGYKLIPLLEKYEAHATLFLITGWWSIDNYQSKYLDIESHTHDMHEGNYCEGEQRGSKLLCSSKEQIVNDLTNSTNVTGSKLAFCFPMYVYNEKSLSAIQEVGFKLAFVGGDTKATRKNNKYQVPRYHIYRETTLDQFINMIS